MAILNKSQILNGASETRTIHIKKLKQDIDLRPLTDGEYNQIEALKSDIGSFKANMDLDKIRNLNPEDIKDIAQEASNPATGMIVEVDPRKTQEKEFEADCLTASFGLSHSGEKWHPSDVKKLKPVGVVKEIAEAVINISGLKDIEELNEEVEDFRQE